MTFNSSIDDVKPLIQEAIDSIAASGGGAVILPEGRWPITAGINITSGVVVAGAGETKTVLVLQDRPSQPVFTLGTPANNTRPRYGFRSNITNQYLPIGSSSVDVISSAGFAVDQLVYVSRNATEAWIRANGMDGLVRNDAQQTWLPVDKRILSPNQISSVSGTNITLRIPLTDNLDSNYAQPELLVYTPPYENSEIGIQDFGIEVPDTCSGAPLNDKTCNSAAVYFPSWTLDSWASALSLKGFNKFFQVDQDASRITIQNCTMNRDQDIQGAALPFDILIQGSQVLIQDCSQVGIPSARCFTVGTGSLTPGPNAVLRHKTKSDVQTIYPHQRWAHGLLVEDSSVQTLFVDRGIKGSGHGWSINGGVGWNLDGNSDFESPPLGINWCVGCGGNGHETKGNATFIESDNIDLFKSLVLGLGHEEDLVDLTNESNATIKAESQASLAHSLLHGREVVGDDERCEEEESVGGSHSVTSKVSWETLTGNDPCETSVRTEETHVEDKTSQVKTLYSHELSGDVELVADTDKNQADEETGKHGDSPETTTESFHEEDGRNGTNQERSTTDKRHVVGLLLVETNLVHENRHVVHDSVDTSELTKKDHNVGVDKSATSSGLSEEVHPGESAVLRSLDNSVLFLDDGGTHDVELLSTDSISENLTKGDVELVERDQVSSDPSLNSLGDVDRDSTTLETDTETQDNTRGNNHALSFIEPASIAAPIVYRIIEMMMAPFRPKYSFAGESKSAPPTAPRGMPELTRLFCLSFRPRSSGRNRGEGDKEPCEVLGVGELDLEESSVKTTSLIKLALHIVNEVINFATTTASDLESLNSSLLVAHGFLDLVFLVIDRGHRVLSTLRHDE
ncbi:hypothetical protein HG531_009009 [Fusarium graminearum]|nr:hypothetical protein HG531_009009 [Fusarium graminearum]